MSAINKFFHYAQVFLNSDFGRALIITVLWKVILLIVGYSISLINHGAGFLEYTDRWDAGWYFNIIHNHYASSGSPAFYPLFPFLVASMHYLSQGAINELLCGQIVNTVSLYFAIVALLKISRKLVGEKKKYWPVILFLTAPGAIFLHVFYSEAVFVAFGFWAYLMALQRKWAAMGILLAILTSARLPAILFVGLCGLEFLRSYGWIPRKFLTKKILWFLLAPLGFIAYGCYLFLTQHNFFAMFTAYHAVKDWSYQVFNLNVVETILRAAFHSGKIILGIDPLNYDTFINILLPFSCLVLLGFCSIFALTYKKDRRLVPLGLFGLSAVVLFTLNSNVVSVNRYVLPILVTYVVLPLIVKWRILLICVCILGVLMQLVTLWLFITYHFAG